jgi:hypothetical protein
MRYAREEKLPPCGRCRPEGYHITQDPIKCRARKINNGTVQDLDEVVDLYENNPFSSKKHSKRSN